MRAILVFLLAAAASGCAGALGGTKPFVLESTPPAGIDHVHEIRLAEVAVGRNANEIDSVGTYHVGTFDEGERKIVEKSLRDSLAAVVWNDTGPAAGPLDLHVVIRHYYTAHSNNDGGIIAAVSWCATDEQGKVTFKDDFFVSGQKSDLEHGVYLGDLKRLLNERTVRRIVDTSTLLAASAEGEGVQPVAVPNIYATVSEAAAPLPQNLVSFFGLPTVSAKQVDWTTGAPDAAFDWPAYFTK
jgi:hypothetical protein